MADMNKGDIEVLNIVQQVLRQFMLSLAAGNKANLGDIGNVLEASAAIETLEPMARQMLSDLAAGAIAFHNAGIRKQ